MLKKQQIGRVLSTRKGRTPIIFILVNNVKKPHSFSEEKREMHEIIMDMI